MGIKRVATFKETKNAKAYVFEDSTMKVETTHAEIANDTLNSTAKLKIDFTAKYGKLIPVFFHINRDGSLAMATGEAPDVWPEDEVFKDFVQENIK